MKTIKVRAAKGMKCPMDNKPREYITDSKAVDVPALSYYNRLVADGSLEIVTEIKKGGNK